MYKYIVVFLRMLLAHLFKPITNYVNTTTGFTIALLFLIIGFILGVTAEKLSK